jgi:hypothetical protein
MLLGDSTILPEIGNMLPREPVSIEETGGQVGNARGINNAGMEWSPRGSGLPEGPPPQWREAAPVPLVQKHFMIWQLAKRA